MKPASGAKKPKESAEHKRLRLEEEARAAESGMRLCPPAILGAQGLHAASLCLAQSASAWRQRLKSRRRRTSCAARAWLRSDRPHRTRRSALTGAAPLPLTSVKLTSIRRSLFLTKLEGELVWQTLAGMLSGSSWRNGSAVAPRYPKSQSMPAAVQKQCCAESSDLHESYFAALQLHTQPHAQACCGKRAQADAEQRKREEEARYLLCTLLPAPDDARGLAAFLAAARPDPALCEPAAVLSSCQAPHPS